MKVRRQVEAGAREGGRWRQGLGKGGRWRWCGDQG